MPKQLMHGIMENIANFEIYYKIFKNVLKMKNIENILVYTNMRYLSYPPKQYHTVQGMLVCCFPNLLG